MCVQTVLSGNGDIFQPSLETCFWFCFGGISSRVEITVIKKAATEGELYCFLDVCVLWCYKRERNQREISTAPLKQFLLHKHLKGHFAKKLLLQNTRHIRKKKISARYRVIIIFSPWQPTSQSPPGFCFEQSRRLSSATSCLLSSSGSPSKKSYTRQETQLNPSSWAAAIAVAPESWQVRNPIQRAHRFFWPC